MKIRPVQRAEIPAFLNSPRCGARSRRTLQSPGYEKRQMQNARRKEQRRAKGEPECFEACFFYPADDGRK
ncbi:MAG: hypothetical protein V2I97_13565 [Desulfococcaceae bacterium]|nr:hypothetical protein [Desulfococcaceae bacterium]